MRALAAACLLMGAAAWAADKTPDKSGSSGVMKDLLKDAASSARAVEATTAEGADGGAAAREGPDIDRMPFTPHSIQEVVTYYQPKIQGCYEEHLASQVNKAVEGKLYTSFVITPDGMVKKAKVDKKKTTLKDPKLHDCVVAVLSTMSFPKPTDGKDHPIEYPFNLKAVR